MLQWRFSLVHLEEGRVVKHTCTRVCICSRACARAPSLLNAVFEHYSVDLSTCLLGSGASRWGRGGGGGGRGGGREWTGLMANRWNAARTLKVPLFYQNEMWLVCVLRYWSTEMCTAPSLLHTHCAGSQVCLVHLSHRGQRGRRFCANANAALVFRAGKSVWTTRADIFSTAPKRRGRGGLSA